MVPHMTCTWYWYIMVYHRGNKNSAQKQRYVCVPAYEVRVSVI